MSAGQGTFLAFATAHGVPADPEQAADSYRKAAVKGKEEARNSLLTLISAPETTSAGK